MVGFMPSFYLMGRNNKAITKGCPFCYLQVAVACKTCPGCKHSFYNAKRISLAQAIHYESLTIVSRRRTERVKREKPNYYDSSEFERKVKKRLERSALEDNKNHCRPQLQTLNKKKGKKKLNKHIKEEDEEPPVTLTTEKMQQCSIILAELNRKMSITTWR